MNPSRFDAAATATVRWLRPEEGGRKRPPTGPIYAATAVFAREELDRASGGGHGYGTAEHISIVLKFPKGQATTELASDVEIDFLARQLVEDRLAPGARIWIMEGTRPVAECEVTSVLL